MIAEVEAANKVAL